MRAALRMQQYRADHKEDPVWLSKEAERMRKIRASCRDPPSDSELGDFVDKNGDALVRSQAVGEGSSLSCEPSSDICANGLISLSDSELGIIMELSNGNRGDICANGLISLSDSDLQGGDSDLQGGFDKNDDTIVRSQAGSEWQGDFVDKNDDALVRSQGGTGEAVCEGSSSSSEFELSSDISSEYSVENDAKKRVALRMKQYRKDYKEDPEWLNNEKEYNPHLVECDSLYTVDTEYSSLYDRGSPYFHKETDSPRCIRHMPADAEAKKRAALRMQQYRAAHPHDPVWLSKEAERMRNLRASRYPSSDSESSSDISSEYSLEYDMDFDNENTYQELLPDQSYEEDGVCEKEVESESTQEITEIKSIEFERSHDDCVLSSEDLERSHDGCVYQHSNKEFEAKGNDLLTNFFLQITLNDRDQPHEEKVKSVLKNEADETDRNNSILYTCHDEMMYQQLLLDHPNAENVKMVLKDENESLETLKVTIEQQIVEVANLGEATEKLTRDLEIHHTAETNAEAAAALEEKLREAAKVKDVKEKETKPNDLLNYKGGAQHKYPYHCNDCTRQFEQLRFFNVHLTTTGHTGRPMPPCNPNPNPNPNPDPTGHTGRPPCKETIDDKTKGLEAGATITPIGYCNLLQYKRPTHNRSYRITQHKMKSLEELNTVIFKALNTVPEVVLNKVKPTEKNISCKIGTQKAKIAAAVNNNNKNNNSNNNSSSSSSNSNNNNNNKNNNDNNNNNNNNSITTSHYTVCKSDHYACDTDYWLYYWLQM
eukprot:CAMPEP_0119051818 /NCGR_PEP_ID=MMETSP1177-20130426/73307_1 /TAXON_ID=2985 /ORGANISM="Ochromonas sp, Strain CCMP1899" /LENGTH=768 /DNA_ID=CAMNT_0007031151 /DNA_START=870 /DNA_END=3176 /DNA_ORIENTATION=-